MGISDKGNGYIFLIGNSTKLVQIDSKDAKFNETFSECRERQGKLSPANHIPPDLQQEDGSDKQVRFALQGDGNKHNQDGDEMSGN